MWMKRGCTSISFTSQLIDEDVVLALFCQSGFFSKLSLVGMLRITPGQFVDCTI